MYQTVANRSRTGMVFIFIFSILVALSLSASLFIIYFFAQYRTVEDSEGIIRIMGVMDYLNFSGRAIDKRTNEKEVFILPVKERKKV